MYMNEGDKVNRVNKVDGGRYLPRLPYLLCLQYLPYLLSP